MRSFSSQPRSVRYGFVGGLDSDLIDSAQSGISDGKSGALVLK